MADWAFYGRRGTLDTLRDLVNKKRWFFCRIQGRRRIGKTSLLRELAKSDETLSGRMIYLQIPDSDERDVASQFSQALADSESDKAQLLATKVVDFISMARAIGMLCRAGMVIILDEFQYFTALRLYPFNSFLQAEVDILRDTEQGGLFVLGSLQSEMSALLDDKSAPLYGRLTTPLQLDHWDFEDLTSVYRDHGLDDPYQWLTLWTFFEGVPKFYRDAYDQRLFDVSGPQLRAALLIRMFLEEGSPLAEEADTSFLREMRGQMLSILHYLAENPGCGHNDLTANLHKSGSATSLGSQIKRLVESYQMVDRRYPVFSNSKSRTARYYITDNFLQAWMSVAKPARDANRIRPIDFAISKAMPRSQTLEGHAFEKLIRQLHVECSKKGKGDFALTSIELGFWNRARSEQRQIEIDLVALNHEDKHVRFGSCKRNAGAHDQKALADFDRHIDSFMMTGEGRKLTGWRIEKALFSPIFLPAQSTTLENAGYRCLDLPTYASLF